MVTKTNSGSLIQGLNTTIGTGILTWTIPETIKINSNGLLINDILITNANYKISLNGHTPSTANASASLDVAINYFHDEGESSIDCGTQTLQIPNASWGQGATKNFSISYTGKSYVATSEIFNISNATKNSVNAQVGIMDFLRVEGTISGGGSFSNGFLGQSLSNTISIYLDVPPTFTNQSVQFDTPGAYAKVTTASVDVDDLTAYYGGYITEAKLTIGNQTAILTGDATDILSSGTLSIQLDTIGTFTPVLTVTDSRGQKKTATLSDITVTAGDDTTFVSTQVTSDTPNFYAAASTASVTISDIVVPYGGSAVSSKLVIGDQEVSGSGAGTLQIALDTVGTFTPEVSVTDSWGRTYSKTLDPITVREYFAPGITFEVDRAASDGTVDEESTTHILVTMPFTYTRDVATFLKPTLKLGVQEQTSNVTWYESWDSVNGVSNPITSWTNYHPASPGTLYALVSGTYQLANTYEVSITAHDSRGKNSEEIAQKVPIAFFTMDFLAGGHGIAFGKLATQADLFECDLDAQFNGNVDIGLDLSVGEDIVAAGNVITTGNLQGENVLLELDTTATSGSDKEIYDALVSLGWTDCIV